MKLLEQKDYVQNPWKNGQGMTTQLAISPKNAIFQDLNFDWRISLAPINSEGDFSLFPGYHRLLVVWQGAGLIILNEENQGQTRRLMPFEIFSFSGEKSLSARLINGPVKDFGVIFKKKLVNAQMSIVTLDKSDFLSFENFNEGEYYFFVASGEFTIGKLSFGVGQCLYFSQFDDMKKIKCFATMHSILIKVSFL